MLLLYNTLTRRKEPVKLRDPERASIYTCGPTVYRYVHIGNLRTYLLADWVRRALEAHGIAVTHVRNITDVGHMRQELLDRGEDKVEAEARARGASPREIAEHYTDAFLADERRLGILPASHYPRATAYVDEMIVLIGRLRAAGFAYEAGGNVYFAVNRFPAYGALSGNTGDDLLEGVRAEADPLKRDPRDFTLWKAAEPGRLMKWQSPWGEGFPGWHIECSAMSMGILGERFDIHTGGVDNIFPHHEGEIAQSEAAVGHRVVEHWVHGQHLLVDNVKMAKSAGNVYTLDQLERWGFDPLAFRLLCTQTHYRTRMNFTFPALRAAQRTLDRLRDRALTLAEEVREGEAPSTAEDGWRRRFREAVDDDLALPRAVATTFQMLRAPLTAAARLRLLLHFDETLGFGLAETVAAGVAMDDVAPIVAEREEARRRGDYARADALRAQAAARGFALSDAPSSTRVRAVLRPDALAERVSRPDEIERCDCPAHERPRFTVGFVAHNNGREVERGVESALRHAGDHDIEVVIVDSASDDETGDRLRRLADRELGVRVVSADHYLGEGAAKNALLRAARGERIILVDPSVEITGDVYSQLAFDLDDPRTGIVGRWGVRSGDLRHFEETDERRVDAVEAYCMALRREVAEEAGPFDESFRFYRNLDIDYSLQVRARGYDLVIDRSLPMERHEHTVWTTMPAEEREKWSKRNFYRVLAKWGDRTDLLLEPAPHEC